MTHSVSTASHRQRLLRRLVPALALAFACAAGVADDTVDAVADAAPECPAGDGWNLCQAEKGDYAAMYSVARRAYDDARVSGDFTTALDWSRRLAATGEKNGERLLKMAYIQLGWGTHRDYVQAYIWLSEGIAGGADYLGHWRSTLAGKMTPDQIAEAKKRAGDQAGR